MSLSGKEILSALKQSRVYWLSRNSGTKEDPNWENPEMEDVQEGDIAWFSGKADKAKALHLPFFGSLLNTEFKKTRGQYLYYVFITTK
jgi:hypothetical protein